MVEETKSVTTAADTELQSSASSQNGARPVEEEKKAPHCTLAELDASIAAYKACFDAMNASFIEGLRAQMGAGFKDPEEYKHKP